jgi:hypothetical protein
MIVALKQRKLEVETLTVLVIRATTTETQKQQYHHCRTSQEELKTALLQEEYLLAKFLYNTIDDTYECPQGETLKTTEDGIKNRRTEQSGYQFKKYRTQLVKPRPVKHLCTSRTGGRE